MEKIFNRKNCCLENFKSLIICHKKVLNRTNNNNVQDESMCNYCSKDSCMLNSKCLQEATITTQNKIKRVHGSSRDPFKKRW